MQADERIVLGNHGITDRAAPSECEPVGRHGRTVVAVAAERWIRCPTKPGAVEAVTGTPSTRAVIATGSR